jgi:DNA-binding transcriptional MerR regulator
VEERELTIGRFAALSGLSAKALRHYDSIGLLKPAGVDRFTGYRLYDRGQLAAAGTIVALRSLGLPLGDVARVLAAPDARLDVLRAHRDHLVAEQAATASRLHAITHLLDLGDDMSDITITTYPATPVVRATAAGAPDSFATLDGDPWDQLARDLPEIAKGARLTWGASEDDDETVVVHFAVELQQDLDAGSDVLGPFEAALVLHDAPAEELPLTVERVLRWVDAQGRHVAAAPMLRILEGTARGHNLIEVWTPLAEPGEGLVDVTVVPVELGVPGDE